ncbi:TPA: transposase, partial [Legionella pneumophila]|nr:transposase [Legionella pneumophila]
SKKYAKGAKEPWIIITSLPKGLNTAKKIIKIYKLRMQIEGAFKDIKNKRYGFRLPESGTKSIKRLENLI